MLGNILFRDDRPQSASINSAIDDTILKTELANSSITFRSTGVEVSCPYYGREVEKALEAMLKGAFGREEPQTYFNFERRLIHYFSRAFLNIRENALNNDLDQMAKDKVWPLFFYTIAKGNYRNFMKDYKYGNTKKVIRQFMREEKISNKQWKKLTHENSAKLYLTFLCSAPVRWNLPVDSLRTILSGQQHYYVMLDPVLSNWFDWYFTRHRPTPELSGLAASLRDLDSMLENMNEPARYWFRERLSQANSMRDMSNYIQNVDQLTGAALYGRYDFQSIERDALTRIGAHPDRYDLLFEAQYNFCEERNLAHSISRQSRPSPSKIKAVSNLPEKVSKDGMTAQLLKTYASLFDEGQYMRHCIYRDYLNRIKRGEYAAYHISCPETDNGYTAGYRYSDEGVWRLHDIRGYKNGLPDSNMIWRFGEYLEERMRKNDV